MAQGDSNSNKTRDVEFKISISTEDIDKIDQQVKNMKIDSKHSDEFNFGRQKMSNNKSQNNKDISCGVILLNRCNKCGNGFKPKNSMLNEPLCNFCIEKNKTA